MSKYLRSTRDGYLFDWNPYLAARADMEEVVGPAAKKQTKPKPRAQEPVETKEASPYDSI